MSQTIALESREGERAAMLADHLLTDIKQRSLVRGDRYLTTEQAGQMLCVSKASANLAMQILTRKKFLTRKQRSGTFIGPAISTLDQAADGQAPESHLEAISVVLSSDRPIPATQIVAGIHEKLPGIDVQFIFLPQERAVEYLGKRVRSIQSAGLRVGFLLISCSQEVYHFFSEQDLPVAVSGDVYRDSQSLPSISPDACQAGRLLVDHLLQKGHLKIALLTFSHWRPGDNHFYEGVSQGLAAAGLSHDALIMRSLPNDPKEFGLEAAALLAEKSPPTAIICQDHAGAAAVARAAKRVGVSVPKGLTVVFGWCEEYWQQDEGCPYPYIRVCSASTKHTTLALAADTIERKHRGENVAGKHVTLPVELVIPKL